MIHCITFANLADQLNTRDFGQTPVYMYPWAAIRKTLEHTHDHLVWIVTNEQLDGFMRQVATNGLEKYLVVRHDKVGQGTTNRNYMDRKLRLKVFIMKGAK